MVNDLIYRPSAWRYGPFSWMSNRNDGDGFPISWRSKHFSNFAFIKCSDPAGAKLHSVNCQKDVLSSGCGVLERVEMSAAVLVSPR